ncbi:MAG: hypothetical protein JOZ24_01055 [Candidatus Eremiobacteraeota bacterium]|nr:hypothetical protein [Candidatus Eremiobacteraeota bacterium]
MTIMATHFALVLGAWRLRVRIDIDEPRESDLRDVQVTAGAGRRRRRGGAARIARRDVGPRLSIGQPG